MVFWGEVTDSEIRPKWIGPLVEHLNSFRLPARMELSAYQASSAGCLGDIGDS